MALLSNAKLSIDNNPGTNTPAYFVTTLVTKKFYKIDTSVIFAPVTNELESNQANYLSQKLTRVSHFAMAILSNTRLCIDNYTLTNTSAYFVPFLVTKKVL